MGLQAMTETSCRAESREMGERLVPYVTGRPNAMLRHRVNLLRQIVPEAKRLLRCRPGGDGLHPLRKTCLPLKTASAGAGML